MTAAIRFLLVSILAVSAQAFAAESMDLAPVMKNMGADMKILGKALIGGQDATKVELEAAAADLAKWIVVAATKAPHQMLNENGEVKSEAKADLAKFDETLNRLLLAVRELQTALAKDDRAAATDILKTKIVPVQKEGHENFRQTE